MIGRYRIDAHSEAPIIVISIRDMALLLIGIISYKVCTMIYRAWIKIRTLYFLLRVNLAEVNIRLPKPLQSTCHFLHIASKQT